MTLEPNDANQPEKLEIQKVLDHPVIGRGSRTGTLEEFKRQLRKVLKRRKLFKKPGLFALAFLLLIARANADGNDRQNPESVINRKERTEPRVRMFSFFEGSEFFAVSPLLLSKSCRLACARATTRSAAGVASWYGEEHRGKIMANGRPFDPDRLTAASWFYPLGMHVRVRSGSRSVVVEITDRGPARRLVRQGRTLDLSYAAFRKLANPEQGLVAVSVSKLR